MHSDRGLSEDRADSARWQPSQACLDCMYGQSCFAFATIPPKHTKSLINGTRVGDNDATLFCWSPERLRQASIMGTSPCATDFATPAGKPELVRPSPRFQPLDPDKAVEVTELRRQRLLCGWGADSIDKWLDMIRKGDRVSHSELFSPISQWAGDMPKGHLLTACCVVYQKSALCQLMFWIVDDSDNSVPVENEPRFCDFLDGVEVEHEDVPAADASFLPVGHFGKLLSARWPAWLTLLMFNSPRLGRLSWR